MKNPKTHTAKRGLALVVVVSLMALLTVMILGLLMLSSNNRATANNDVSARKAKNIASAAVNTVIADVLQEMKNGSTPDPSAAEVKAPFAVDIPKSMVPERSLKSTVNSADYPTLIKQSANGVAFASASQMPSPTAVPSRASSVSTIAPAVGGRFVASTSWADPKFFPPGNNLADNQTPDWTYISRNGGNPTSFSPANKNPIATNGDYVVGRYAYQVYDTSGLIDINVAGNFAGNPPTGVQRKDSLARVDLTAIGLDQNKRIDLTAWRRKASSSLPFEDFIEEWGRKRGWQESPTVGSASDNVFLSRSDLIDYQKANSSTIPDDALQHIITSSSALNRPSWSPQHNSTINGFEYLTNRDKPTAINRRIDAVRVTTPFTRRDGSTAKSGEPLMKTRFPISKLRAFAGGDTQSADYNAADILEYFGLKPNTMDGTQVLSWTMAGYSVGQTIAISTLKQVADAGREPKFFEVLKAALMEGSLGNALAGDSMSDDTRDQSIDYQVLRIGANIIDQYDSNDIPTTIHNGATNPTAQVSIDNAIGIENLPYFHLMPYVFIRRRDLNTPPDDNFLSAFITFQMWNPHANPSPLNNVELRIALAGDFNASIINQVISRNGSTFDTDYIQFNGATFESPTLVHPDNPSVTTSQTYDYIRSSGIKVVGFNAGGGTYADLQYSDAEGATPKEKHNKKYPDGGWGHKLRIDPSGATEIYVYALQAKFNGKWVNYFYLPVKGWAHDAEDFPADPTSTWNNTDRIIASNGYSGHSATAGMIDPRINRFGHHSCWHALTLNQPDSLHSNPGQHQGVYFFQAFFFHKPPYSINRQDFVRPAWFTDNDPTSVWSMYDRDKQRRPADAGSPTLNPANKPIILNRAFECVADMGYASRDEVWKSLNLFGDPNDPNFQGDGALLDFFSLNENDVVSATINPNTATTNVMGMIMNGAAQREGVALASSQAASYAAGIRTSLDTTPLRNPADLAKIASSIATSSNIPDFKNRNDIEVIPRALADVTDTRTWRFFIDVVAQSGRLVGSATSLNQFEIDAQTRDWYSVHIDRFTGEVINIKKEN